MNTPTVTGSLSVPQSGMRQAQLLGGQFDGKEVLVPLHGTAIPDRINYAGNLYHADGTFSDGTPRYSLPQYVGMYPLKKK